MTDEERKVKISQLTEENRQLFLRYVEMLLEEQEKGGKQHDDAGRICRTDCRHDGGRKAEIV